MVSVEGPASRGLRILLPSMHLALCRPFHMLLTYKRNWITTDNINCPRAARTSSKCEHLPTSMSLSWNAQSFKISVPHIPNTSLIHLLWRLVTSAVSPIWSLRTLYSTPCNAEQLRASLTTHISCVPRYTFVGYLHGTGQCSIVQ